MEYVEDDGGRAAAGFKGKTGDCVTRAFSLGQFGRRPSGDQYRVVYDRFAAILKEWAFTGRVSKAKRPYRDGKRPTSPRNGMPRQVIDLYVEEIGWLWTPAKAFGATGAVHMKASELPGGTLVTNQARHLACVIDGVVYDIWDSTQSRTMGDEMRMVYGWWTAS